MASSFSTSPLRPDLRVMAHLDYKSGSSVLPQVSTSPRLWPTIRSGPLLLLQRLQQSVGPDLFFGQRDSGSSAISTQNPCFFFHRLQEHAKIDSDLQQKHTVWGSTLSLSPPSGNNSATEGLSGAPRSTAIDHFFN